MSKKPLFHSTFQNKPFRSAYIVGACRSGKTTLCTLLSSYKHVENSEEAWGLKNFMLLNYLKQLNNNITQQLFLSYSNEIFNENYFLRNVSFRKSDNSYIRNFKSKEEISARLKINKSREYVKSYINKNNPMMIFNLTEVNPQCHKLINFSKNSKLIYIIRNYKDVSYDCYKKKWFNDESLLNPIKTLPYYNLTFRKKIWKIPWWVEKNFFVDFIDMSDFDRCLYYWIRNNELGLKSLKKIKNNYFKIINYDNFLENPLNKLEQISNFLKINKTNKTNIYLKKILNRKNNSKRIKFDKNLILKATNIENAFSKS